VIVGLPGAGKSTTGRRLAKILAVGFSDSDDLVERADGRTVRAIFAESGEPAFRAIESAVITAALADFDGILALGGGALTVEATREAVVSSGVPVVVLKAARDTLRLRVGDASTRPLLADDPEGRLAELDRERAPVFDAVCAFSVDTDDRTPGQVAAKVAARLHEMRTR